MKILGVKVDNKLKFQEQIDQVKSNTSQCFFALRTLKQHGLSLSFLQNIFRATIIPKMLYAAPAYWGYINKNNISQLQAILNRGRKLNYYTESDPDITDLVARQETDLFTKIESNPTHILHKLLPETMIHSYNTRNKSRYKLPEKDDKLFINRMIYKNLNK